MTEVLRTAPICGGCTLDGSQPFCFWVQAFDGIDLTTLDVEVNGSNIVAAGVPSGGWGLVSAAFSNPSGSGFKITLTPPTPFDGGVEVCFELRIDSLSGIPIDGGPVPCGLDSLLCCYRVGLPHGACNPLPDPPPPEPPIPIIVPNLPILEPIGFNCGAKALNPCEPVQFTLATPSAEPLVGTTLEVWVDDVRVLAAGVSDNADQYTTSVVPDPSAPPFEASTYLVEIVPIVLPWQARDFTFLFSIADLAGTVSSAFQSCAARFASRLALQQVIQNLTCAALTIDGITIPAREFDDAGNCIGGFILYQNLPSLSSFVENGCVVVTFRTAAVPCG